MTMADQDINIRLEGGGPWGFRLTGGKDFGSPLTVSKITPGGKASYNGLREKDQILSINYEDTRNMIHIEAQEAIKRAGSTLDLSVRRGDSPKIGRAPLTKTETLHSGKVDHKYNAIPKPFGATSYQPPRQSPASPSGAQPAPTVRSGPPQTAPKPSSPMAPAYSHYTGGPPRNTGGPPGRDFIDSDAAMRAKKKEIEEEMLSQRFKLSISDDGEVNYDEASQVPNWGNPPDPNVQSKSFKMLQRHLQQHEDDDLPPPPPEAYDVDPDEEKVQSKSFQMLRSAVDSGETPPSVFSRDRGDRTKPSTTPMPSRPTVPIARSTNEPSYAPPPMSRPGQTPPVALPGMARQEPLPQSSPPKIKTQRPQAPSVHNPSHPPSAPQPPRAPAYGGGQHQEIKRQPIKPPQPADGSRTPYCDACGQEIFGPFVSAIGRSWHPDHFTCAGCGDSLQNQGFIEEGGKLYCEKDYNKHFAPQCNSCKQPIIGPKSLHACVFPKSTPQSSVPVPSSDMLKAIRQGQPTAKIPRKPKINPSLVTHKKSLSESNNYGKVHYPIHGIDYMSRRDSSHSRSRTSSTGSSDSGNVFRSRSESSSDQWEPLVSPRAVKEFEKLHAEMTYAEPGSGSMKDKVKQLKEQVRSAIQQEKDANEAKEVAAQRYKKSKILSNELKWRIQDAEDKLQRLETKLENTRGRLYERSRVVQESLGNKRRAEHVTKENIREKENIEYEMTEVNAARDSALNRLREVSRRLAVKQAAIQNAEDHFNAMNARSKMLSDMKEMYKLRINNIHSRSSQLSMRNEKQVHRIHIVEDSIAECTERFKRAEKMMLPLKIYLNQLQDAVTEEKSNTRRLSYELAAYQQRLRAARHYTDF